MINVYLDTNYLLKQGHHLDGSDLRILEDLEEAGVVHFVTSDYSRKELRRRLARNSFSYYSDLTKPYFADRANKTLGLKLPELSKDKLSQLCAEYAEKVEKKLFSRLGMKEASIADVGPAVVMDDYLQERLFFDPKAKKGQFPDAFIWHAIAMKFVKENYSPDVIILSEDGDFRAALASEKKVKHAKSLEELLGLLGFSTNDLDLDFEKLSENESVFDAFSYALRDEYFNLTDIEDAEVEFESLHWIELQELRTFAPISKGGDSLILGSVRARLEVSYSHPDWENAPYDSEDKKLMPLETIQGSASVECQIPFSMVIKIDPDGDVLEEPGVNLNTRWAIDVELDSIYDYY